MASHETHSRQMRLPEVGPDGQALLGAGSVLIGSDDGAMTELAYLERAGVGVVHVRAGQSSTAFPHRAAFRSDAARAFAAGSWRALNAISAILEPRP